MPDLIDRIKGVLTAEEVLRFAGTPAAPPPLPTPALPPTKGVRLLAKDLTHEYGTFYPVDILHRGALLQHPGGAFGLHYLSSGALNQMLPAIISHSAQPRWRRKQPDHLVFRYLDELRDFNAGDGTISTIRKFNLPDINNGKGESDVSIDDDHIALCSGQQIFVYEFSTDRIVYEFTALGSFNNFYITSSNEVIVGYNVPKAPLTLPLLNDKSGHILHRKDGSTFLLATGLGHMDCSADKSGNPIMVWNNSLDDSGANRNAKLPNCTNGVVLVDLASGKQTCLAQIPWEFAMHISLPDHAEFVLVSLYNKTSTENLKVGFDGSVASLGKHGPAPTYEEQPHASISPDGTQYIYNDSGDTWLGTL